MVWVKRAIFIGCPILVLGIAWVWIGSDRLLPLGTSTLLVREKNPKELVDEVWNIVDWNYVDATFNKVDWKAVRKKYLDRQYTTQEDAYKAVREMLKQLNNPYTRFMDPEEFKNMQIDTSSELTGVGIQLAADEKTKKLTVISPIEGSPASAAGILSKDIILKIDDKSTVGMDVNKAVTLVRGAAGTKVTLTIQRGDTTLVFPLKRTKIEIHPVRFNVQKGPIGEIGYIRLVQFSTNAASEMKQAIQALEKKQVTGYILDLRSNPGGLLHASVDIASMWLKEGTIVSMVDRRGESDRETANRRALTDKPLVILVDGGSASASEILSGALKDNNRAILVGTKTFGMGLLQSVRKLTSDEGKSGMAVTIAKYLTPNGRDIHKHGIDPDFVVKLTKDQEEFLQKNREKIGTSEDPQFVKALEVLNRPIKVVGISSVEPVIGTGSAISDGSCHIKSSLDVSLHDAEKAAEKVAQECLENFLPRQGNSWFAWHAQGDSWQLEEWNAEFKIENSALSKADELNGLRWKGSGELEIKAMRVKKDNDWQKDWYTPEFPESKISMSLEHVEGVWSVKLDLPGRYKKPKDNELPN